MKKRKSKDKKEYKKISSGIKGFDYISKGGFEKGSINLVIGDSGSGKSIFALNFLVRGAKNKENVLYVSFEEKKEEFYKNMKEIGFKLEELEKNNFNFVEYTPEKVKTMLEEGGGDIESIILKKKISRIVIDSLNSFLLLFEDEFKQREAILSLFNLLRSWKCSALLTYESKVSPRKQQTPSILEFESDSIVVLYFLIEGSERKRYLEIFKMRGTDHSKNLHEFFIKKSGVSINKKPVKKILNL